MCGRYTLASPDEIVAETFGLDEVPTLRPRYNIAPTQKVAVVRREGSRRRLAELRWGLIPSWAKDPAIGNKLINARAETLAEKPAFRSAFRARRCLVVADGFYEWAKAAGRKQPWYFHLRDARPFGLAGLWERWPGEGGEPLETCTIITTAANELLAPVHDRMPVILEPGAFDAWLDPGSGKGLVELLRPLPAEAMAAYPVSLLVNSPGNDTPACIAPQ
jgi:putative SOS response-associated peptidase YedK